MTGAGPGAGAAPARPGRARLLPFILLTASLGTLVTDALTPRDLSLGEDEPEWNADPAILAYKLMRLATLALVAVGAVAVTRGVIRKGFPRAGLAVWLGYLAFVATCFVLPGVAGRVPGFDGRLLYPPVAFLALAFARPVPRDVLARLCKVALGATVWASLAAAVVRPSQAIAANYVGFFPWPDFRLYGVGGGAISLGVQSSCFLLLEVVAPSRPRWRWPNLAAGALALFLTQAKTSWLFLAFALAVLAARALARRRAARARPASASARALGRLAVAAGLAAALGAGAWRLSQVDVTSLRGGENLASFTGRTYIWVTSLNTWLDDPVLGYGLGLWEGAYRQKYAPLYPHAHNQFIQTLASAGLVGLLGLLAYLWGAWRAARRALPADPVPMVLLGAILAQCLTNVPLRGQYLLEPLVVVHLLLFAALVNAEKLAAPAAAPAAEAPEPAGEPALTRAPGPAAP